MAVAPALFVFPTAAGAAEWSPTRITLPAGSAEGGLGGVSCPAADSCLAVGTSVEGFGDVQPLGVAENGGSWTQTLVAAGAAGGQFTGVSCREAESCTAVGVEGFLTIGRPVAASYTDGSWSQAASIVPEGGSPQVGLGEVSCPGAGPCVVAGADEDQPVVYTGEGAEAGQGSDGGASVRTVQGGATIRTSPGACEVSLVGTKVPVTRAHVAKVGLTDTGGAACTGTVTLSVKATSKGKGAKGKRKKPKARVIGRGSVKLAPGATATVSVRLNGTGEDRSREGRRTPEGDPLGRGRRRADPEAGPPARGQAETTWKADGTAVTRRKPDLHPGHSGRGTPERNR